jgi:hypothetical protein
VKILSHLDGIRAWNDEEYQLSLSEAERALQPPHNDFVRFQTSVKALPEAEVRSVHPLLSEDRFRRRYGLAPPAGDEQILLVGDPARHELVSRADFALLHGCTRFATLEAHASGMVFP